VWCRSFCEEEAFYWRTFCVMCVCVYSYTRFLFIQRVTRRRRHIFSFKKRFFNLVPLFIKTIYAPITHIIRTPRTSVIVRVF
jgi:hypothetical protein